MKSKLVLTVGFPLLAIGATIFYLEFLKPKNIAWEGTLGYVLMMTAIAILFLPRDSKK